jgi:DNA-binding NarL/FixJ family response regulator
VPDSRLERAGRARAGGEVPRLSPRQAEVLGLLDRGLRARAIAAVLGLSETTVRNHIRALLHRLDSHSQLQALARARERHLL